MKLPRSSGKPKRRKLLVVRRVRGRSMLPYLNPGQVVIGYGWFRSVKPQDIVIFEHQGKEKIKRVFVVGADGLIVVGDNKPESTDSRHFGPVAMNKVRAKVIS